jgi:hypothetical protein
MALNLFGSPTKDDIKVAYIDPILGLVEGVSICEANEYAKKEPGTTFIFRNGNQTLQYLNVNEINQLDPNVLITTDECGGISQKKECGPPTIQIFGGGGIGAAGNPIVGNDGAILAVDIIRGGNGYQYPPLVSARDICNYGSGATFTTVIGEVVETTETFDNEADFEDYELCDPTDVGYGQNWGPDGEDLGPWDPRVYTNPGEDPIRKEIADYQALVRRLARTPFWTTRKNKPTKITSNDVRIIPSKYDVTHPAWNKFFNSYAVSPVSPSNVKGTDFGATTFTMEWTEEFPTTGEYIIRGTADGKISELYIDDQIIGPLSFGVISSYSGGNEQSPTLFQRTITQGIHRIRVDILNGSFEEIVPGQYITEERIGGSLFVKEGDSYYILIGGNDIIEIDFVFEWEDNESFGYAVTEITIPTESGVPVILSRPLSGTVGSSKATGTFRADKKYGPIIFGGRAPESRDPEIGDAGPGLGQRQQRIFFWDTEPGDLYSNAQVTAVTARQLSPGRVITSAPVKVISPRSWNENPLGFALTIDAPAAPPPPQEQPPQQEGRCPNNPIWTTRFPGAKEFWYPVNYRGERKQETLSTVSVDKPFGSIFIKDGDSYYILIGGNDIVEIDFVFNWFDSADFGYALTKITIPTETGGPVVLSRPLSGTTGSSKGTGTFKADGKYGPIIFDGVASRGQIVDSGPAPGQRQQIIEFFDNEVNDLISNANLHAVNARQLSQPKENIIPSITVTPGWSKFLNRYAISPVRPLDTPGSDGGGSLFTNSWDIDIPYDGFYKFVAEQDDYGKIYLDGQIINLSKVFITRGRHTIGVELENRKTEAFDQVSQKIFRTLDWQVGSTTEEKPAGSIFVKEGDSYYILIGGNDIVEVDFVFNWYDDANFEYALTKVTIPTETGGPVVLSRPLEGTIGSSKATGTFRADKKYGPIDFEGVAARGKIVDSGPAPEQRQQIIEFFDNNVNDSISNANLYAVNSRQLSPARLTGGLTGGISRDGVTYEGPSIFHYQDNRWGSYMNKNSISPVIPGDSADASGRKQFIWRGVNFPESGQYDVQFLADTNAGLIIGGTRVLSSQGFAENPQTFKVNITQGTYDITVDSEYPYNSLETNNTQYFRDINPTGFALEIRKNISVLREGSGKSWKENPMGIGAILIPPPCPRRIRGKGVVTDVIVNDPGNGYLPPIAPTITPPSTLALIQTNVPGVPGSGAGAGAGGGTGAPGGLPGVPAVPLSIPSPPSGAPTGINASFRPQFEVVRDPVVIDPQKLLQVTDLVGLKQTGYVNGRAYYGAVYYDKGIRYAGFYETVGEPIQVYDTLRESILAQVITPPSAILRQGTDIRSNDPLLNIPGTVQSTLSSNSIVGAGDIFPPSVPFVPEPVQDPIYPVSLRLKRVLVEDPGINYNVTDKIRVIPSNGAILEPIFGSFGRVIKVAVIDPGFGFTEYPQIEMYTPL